MKKTQKKRIGFYVWIHLVMGLGLAGQPLDNPVSERYGVGAYIWSWEIAWERVEDITAHGGVGDGETPNDGAYAAARAALVARGGGVLYFPAGTYYFADSIGLADNVVLRGETPQEQVAGAVGYRPPSRLVFPKYAFVAEGEGTDPDTAFKGIGVVEGSLGKNMGLVNLDINRAWVFAGGYGVESQNVILFGIRSNNVASEQTWTVPTPEQNAWQVHPNRFAANLSAFAYRNVLVAHCVVNDKHYWKHREADGKALDGAPEDLAEMAIDDFAQPGYKVRDGGVWRSLEDIAGVTYTFNYTDHYGINVQGSTGEWGAAPWEQPNLYYGGAEIRDNWVYTTMRVKIDASGRGLRIIDNVLKDREGKQRWVSPNGDQLVQNAATLENRGIDWRGHDVVIEGNQIEVYRHRLKTSGYSSVDGEGILHQEIHGTTIDNVVIRNNTANAYIGIWKMPYTRNVLIEGNRLTGPGYIYVNANTNNAGHPLYDVVIRDNVVEQNGIHVAASYYAEERMAARVTGNRVAGRIEVEALMEVKGNTRLDGVTAAEVTRREGAVAIAAPSEGVFVASENPDTAALGAEIAFRVEITESADVVEAVEIYRGKALMHTVTEAPYNYVHEADGTGGVWSARVKQAATTAGYVPYTALLLRVPEAPERVWAEARSDRHIVVRWAANALPGLGYRVERYVEAEQQWQWVADVDAGATAQLVGGLARGMAYRLRVGALDGATVVGWTETTGATLETAIASTFGPEGLAWPMGAVVEVEDYDEGGYADSTQANLGESGYRAGDAVDIGEAALGRRYVGWPTAGEWLAYTFAVEKTGLYTLELEYAATAAGDVGIEVDGEVVGQLALAATGGVDAYAVARLEGLTFAAGFRRVKLVMGAGDYRMDSLRIELADRLGYAHWRALALADSALAGFGDDADGDGVANGLEWLYGSDPLVAEPDGLQWAFLEGEWGWEIPMARGNAGARLLMWAESLAGPWRALPLEDLAVVREGAQRVLYRLGSAAGGFVRVGVDAVD